MKEQSSLTGLFRHDVRRVTVVNLFPSALLGFITQKLCLPAHTLYTLQNSELRDTPSK